MSELDKNLISNVMTVTKCNIYQSYLVDFFEIWNGAFLFNNFQYGVDGSSGATMGVRSGTHAQLQHLTKDSRRFVVLINAADSINETIKCVIF